MGSALAISPAFETKWTMVSGGMKGAVRLMSAAQFSLGRSPECEFVIVNDPKCSRKHASVQWVGQDCQIISLNPQNLVLVNGKEVQSSNLTDGDIVTLGETEVLFNLTTIPAVAPGPDHFPPPPGPVPMAYNIAFAPAPASAQHMAPARSRASRGNNTNRLVFYFIIGIVVLFFLTPSGKKKKEEQALRTEQQIQADIEAANKLQEAAMNTPTKKMDQSIPIRQAQENFVRGFRDYRKGQYERSLDSFQACLSLDPTHPLCNRYIRLAQRRFNELVQYNIVLGRKYRDQNQFQACRAAFRNVMVMVKDSNSLAYKESKANYDACNTLVEGRY